MAGAERLEAELARTGQLTGPLHGVVVLVKDEIDVAGTATTQGVRVFANYRPPRDAFVVAKLRKAGDERAVAILDIILRDEIGHVAIGNRWYRWLCQRDGLDAEALYPQLVARYAAPRLRPPFNLAARRAAGFSEAELNDLR